MVRDPPEREPKIVSERLVFLDGMAKIEKPKVKQVKEVIP